MSSLNVLSEQDVRIIENFITLLRRQPGLRAEMRSVWLAERQPLEAVARDFDQLIEDVYKVQGVGPVGIAPSLVLLANVARKVTSIPNRCVPSKALAERCLKEFYATR